MMDSTDVRVGNWVLNITGTVNKDETFFEYKPVVLDEYYYKIAPVCFPIPLSPDLLGKCGFKHEFGDWYRNLPSGDKEGGVPFLRYKCKTGTWYLKDMEIPSQPLFVHQLQNLYYAFTKKELTIRLGDYENSFRSGPVTLSVLPVPNRSLTPFLQ